MIEITQSQLIIGIILGIILACQSFYAGFIAADMNDASPLERLITAFAITLFGLIIILALLLWEIPKKISYTFCIKDAWSLRFTKKLNTLTEEQLTNLNRIYTAWYYSNKSFKRYFKLKTFKQIANRNNHTLVLGKQKAPR